MKVVALLLALLGQAALAANVAAEAPHLLQPEARHKAGPVTLRGVAQHVGPKSFTLVTTTHGTYTVDDSAPTRIVEQGRSGTIRVTEGEHVGVRGYLKGRSMRAIQVRVYPTAPKQVSVRGTVTAIRSNRLTVRTGTGSVTIVVPSGTVIQSSTGTLALSGLRVNDRIEARVISSGQSSTAVHIHVYRTKSLERHVQVRGTVVAVTSHSVVVRQAGTPYTVGLTSATRLYEGSARSSGPLRVGDQVTVYACCAGQPLVAGSIHRRAARLTSVTTELRGTVTSVTTDSLRLDTPHSPLVRFVSSTVFELGAARTTRAGVRVGDRVSVRGREGGATFTATRVHIYAASRTSTTVRGTVVGVSTGAVRMVQRGVTYTAGIGKGTTVTLGGRRISASQIRPGDRVVAVGRMIGHQMQAASLDVIRVAQKTVTIRGTMVAGGGSWLQITRSTGASEVVRLGPHTVIVFAGRRATAATLFPGVRVIARGTRSGTELEAATISATATVAAETGRLLAARGQSFQLQRSNGKVVTVELPAGASVRDGARAIALGQIGHGAYLHVTGYLVLSKAVRAERVGVLHPVLNLHGVLSRQHSTVAVRTGTGAVFVSTFSRSSSITSNQLYGALQLSDVPEGASVQVAGTMSTSGALAVQSMIVRFRATTLRAKVDALGSGTMTVTAGAAAVHVRLDAGTTITQGSHALTAAEIVVGDDVTVAGYDLNAGVVAARTVAVHRRLLGLDGSVASITGQSFVLTATDGAHTVLVSSSTVVTGPAGTVLAAGMTVHVTGYLRGDATILATRVRVLKPA